MRIVKKILKFLAWSSAVMAVLVVATYLLFLSANWNDRPPSKAALQLDEFYRNRPSLRDEDNAYVYLMGFSVEKAEAPREWGVKRVAWAQRLVGRSGDEADDPRPGEDFDFKTTRSAAVRALSEACRTVDHACLSALESGEEAIAEWLETEGWVLDRYRTLLAHPGWRETVPFDVHMPLPPYADVLEGQKLLLARAWQLAGRGDAASVQALLEEDVRFWRHSLEASDILISKLIAVAALKRHFAWSNIVLRRLPANAMLLGVPQQWMEPLSESERSMMRCLTGEWEFYKSSMRQIAERGLDPLTMDAFLDEESAAQRLLWRMFAPMLQPQETSNKYAELIAAIAETLRVPIEQFPEAVERAMALEQNAAEAAMPPARMYNIVGDTLFAISIPEYTSYAVRVGDLEGVRRGALLATQLRSRRIAPEGVSGHLEGDAVRDPYSGKPFAWDDGARAIVFSGLEPGERGRHVLLY